MDTLYDDLKIKYRMMDPNLINGFLDEDKSASQSGILDKDGTDTDISG